MVDLGSEFLGVVRMTTKGADHSQDKNSASELIADGAELWPLDGDEAFFAAHTFRVARFSFVVPELKVLGLAYAEAFEGKSYRCSINKRGATKEWGTASLHCLQRFLKFATPIRRTDPDRGRTGKSITREGRKTNFTSLCGSR